MLKELLEKIKKNEPGILIMKRGGCRYCGQIADLEVPEGWEENVCDEVATEMCECISATIYTRKKRQKEKAAEAIEEQFGETGSGTEDDVRELLTDIADKVVEQKINSGTIDMGNGTKAKISINAKGLVKVERTKTEKATREA